MVRAVEAVRAVAAGQEAKFANGEVKQYYATRDPEGRAIEDKIRAAGRQDILPWLRDRRAEADAIAANYEGAGQGVKARPLDQGGVPAKAMMVNGVPVTVLNQMAMRDNYAPPSVSSFIPAAVMNLAEGVISKYNLKKPEPKVSQEDIDRASVIVEPIIEKAAQGSAAVLLCGA